MFFEPSHLWHLLWCGGLTAGHGGSSGIPIIIKEFMTDPAYAQLRAVQNGNVIEAPYWAKPWGNPDADSVALGELWLAHMSYPDKVRADVVAARAKKFYEAFYGVPFTGTVSDGIQRK